VRRQVRRRLGGVQEARAAHLRPGRGLASWLLACLVHKTTTTPSNPPPASTSNHTRWTSAFNAPGHGSSTCARQVRLTLSCRSAGRRPVPGERRGLAWSRCPFAPYASPWLNLLI
jgi:hypothetical protein